MVFCNFDFCKVLLLKQNYNILVKFIKLLILSFITLITSSSILFDWSDYAHIATLKNTGYTILDKYDEVSTSSRTVSYELISFCSAPLSKSETSNIEFDFVFISKSKFCACFVQNPCKIKSYLHLLQLF